MYVTPRFVFLHLPKTGGTFVERALQRLEPGRGRTLANRVARKLGLCVTVELPQHGTYRDTPVAVRGRPMLTVLRNPLDQYVSEFHFDRHHDHPEQFGGSNPVIRARWPRFPDLSFDEFVRYMNTERTTMKFPGLPPEQQPGLFSQIFIQFFAINPNQLARDLTPELVRSGAIRRYLCPELHVLFTHQLNDGLYTFLKSMGYPERRVGWIKRQGRVLPEGGQKQAKGRAGDDRWPSRYTPELMQYVVQREWVLFELYPELRVDAGAARLFQRAA